MRSSKCHTCQHPKVDEIDKRLWAGEQVKIIAEEYGLPYHAVWEHKNREHAINIAPATIEQQEQILACVKEKFKVVDEAEAAMFEAKDRYAGIREQENLLGKYTTLGNNMFKIYLKVLFDYFKLSDKTIQSKGVQVNIWMPVFLRVIEGMPGHLKKQIYDYTKLHPEILDVLDEPEEIEIQENKED